MECKICETRKPRRYCPGVNGDICSICCGNERENTIDCPLECPYLQEAHDRERPTHYDAAALPNRDIQVSDRFIRAQEPLLTYILALVFRAAMDTPGTVDQDVEEALEAVIRTYRTLSTGLQYDSRPEKPIPAAIFTQIREGVDTIRKSLVEKGTTPRDMEFLGIFVYVQRVELARNNRRPRGRAFLDLLQRMFPEYKTAQPAAPLIIA